MRPAHTCAAGIIGLLVIGASRPAAAQESRTSWFFLGDLWLGYGDCFDKLCSRFPSADTWSSNSRIGGGFTVVEMIPARSWARPRLEALLFAEAKPGTTDSHSVRGGGRFSVELLWFDRPSVSGGLVLGFLSLESREVPCLDQPDETRLNVFYSSSIGVRLALPRDLFFFLPQVSYGRVVDLHYGAPTATVEWTMSVGIDRFIFGWDTGP